MTRRRFLHAALSAAGSLALVPRISAEPGAGPEPLFHLHRRFKSSVPVAAMDLLRNGEQWFVRATSADGAVGISAPNERIRVLHPMLSELVLPFFLGKDARDLEDLVDGVYVHRSNYKYAGIALWNCVAWVEIALFDLLGKLAGAPAGELLGGVRRKEVPVYLSSLRRDTTPEAEVEWISKRLAETGARAVKLKIGGRMSRNADAAPGRTERLVALARKTWGGELTIQVDANGSYDAPKAIEVGRVLEEHGVYFYEEPCTWEDFEATRRVADALEKVLVAGGEQDTSYEKFAWYVKNRGLDIVQPDVSYNGGFTRTMRVARLAEGAKLDITPHAPQGGMSVAYMLQLASAVPNLGRFQEFNGAPQTPPAWLEPKLAPRAGAIAVPAGPGLGMTVDPDFLKKAQRVAGAAN
ncbi:MAG: mandelate racemase/muconate lactonizing enzyme family protein [Planctomycetes bacterium]|nr:mandelate racemase/muconate lactonizing enzyme family protein [Planctomycetota bacterium]